MSCWRAGPNGVTVQVKVQPRARRPGVARPAGAADRLRVAVTAPPADGRANRAACAALAEALDVPSSAVTLVTGAAAREKVLLVAGDPAVLGQRLEAL